MCFSGASRCSPVVHLFDSSLFRIVLDALDSKTRNQKGRGRQRTRARVSTQDTQDAELLGCSEWVTRDSGADHSERAERCGAGGHVGEPPPYGGAARDGRAPAFRDQPRAWIRIMRR